MTQTYKYLHFISFQSLVNWSVAHLLNRDLGFMKHYPFIRIGDVLCRSALPVTIEDNILYTQVTLKTNGGGAVLRDKKLGKDIGTKKQYLAKEGQFIMSKIDARNGAFGIITKELKGAVVTGDFPLFDVDANKINPTYLYLLSSTQPFVQYAQSCSRGTTNRQRIDIDAFLSLQIPLPSLDEQNNIVAAYNSALAQSALYARQAQDIDSQIEAYLQDILGIQQTDTATKRNAIGKFLWLVNSKDIICWDVYNVKTTHTGKYDSVYLSEIISKLSTGTTPPTHNKEYFAGGIDFYTPADINGDMYLGDAERHISQSAIEDKKARLFSRGDLLFVGIGSTVGKVGLVSKDVVSSNQQITGITFNTSRIMPEYAFVYMHYFKESTTADKSKTTLPIINQEKIGQIQIPLPPLVIQNEIVSHISSLRAERKALQQQSLSLRSDAQHQFTKTIFN